MLRLTKSDLGVLEAANKLLHALFSWDLLTIFSFCRIFFAVSCDLFGSSVTGATSHIYGMYRPWPDERCRAGKSLGIPA